MENINIAILLLIAAQTSYLFYAQVKKTTHAKKQHMPVFVDTSVLIDGRIVSIAASGFITSTLFIPRSVIGELQFLADNGDTEKRTRARHGLDVVRELQSLAQATVEIYADSTTAEEGVDNRLLKLAKEYNGAICTIDFNLNKVAQVEGIPVLNVNDLAKTLRMAYLPGERLRLELHQKGNDQHQAVGHLPDGTMVVVEHASSQLGKTVEVEFIRSLQTAAGKMMFARLVGAEKKQAAQRPAKPASQPKQQTQRPQQASPAKQPKKQPQQRRRGPKTNEDRLVELANQQES